MSKFGRFLLWGLAATGAVALTIVIAAFLFVSASSPHYGPKIELDREHTERTLERHGLDHRKWLKAIQDSQILTYSLDHHHSWALLEVDRAELKRQIDTNLIARQQIQLASELSGSRKQAFDQLVTCLKRAYPDVVNANQVMFLTASMRKESLGYAEALLFFGADSRVLYGECR
jgi:hypothetical protein